MLSRLCGRTLSRATKDSVARRRWVRGLSPAVLIVCVSLAASPASSLSQGLIDDTSLYGGPAASPFGSGSLVGEAGDSPQGRERLLAQVREGKEAEERREAFVEGSEGQEERAASRSAFDDLSDAAAVEVMKREFAGELRAPVPDAETLLSGDRVIEYESDFVARVEGSHGRPDRIIDSQVPLRTPGSREPVDLDLERTVMKGRPLRPILGALTPCAPESGLTRSGART